MTFSTKIFPLNDEFFVKLAKSAIILDVDKRKNLSSQKIFREINFSVTSLVTSLLSRNFREKTVRVNFSNFYTLFNSISRKISKLHVFIQLQLFIT